MKNAKIASSISLVGCLTTPSTTLANDIMRTIQSNFDTKQYISTNSIEETTQKNAEGNIINNSLRSYLLYILFF